uniref:M superfamily MMSK group conopeptide Co3-TP01 n=1 Tax=Conus coronatus TaxID=89441 RepID=H2BKL8_CONCS|nr:M superfamily MMSK group conopeptide Co3-TP01 [Conus coronatus]
MMFKLGVFLTICLLPFSLNAVPLDGDQPADQPAERLLDDISFENNPFYDPAKRCCRTCFGCTPCCG